MTATGFTNTGLADGDPWAEQDPPREEPIDKAFKDRFPTLDWEAAFAKDYSVVDWLPGKFMERGQQIALVGGAKAGKSLFMHEWLWCAVTGRAFLADIARERLKVLYFDKENAERDIITRMRALGATPAELTGRFIYKQFPAFSGTLDQNPLAAAEFHAIVADESPDIVVLDTACRFIGGKENDAETWTGLNRLIQEPLKRQGISYTRLDHFGKDESRGARGNSAKDGDVDHVWELTVVSDRSTVDSGTGVETVTTNLKLERTHTRSGVGRGLFAITRTGQKESVDGPWLPGRTRHAPSSIGPEHTISAKINGYVNALVAANAPELGRDKLMDWAAANGVEMPRGTQEKAEVVKAFKARMRAAGR